MSDTGDGFCVECGEYFHLDDTGGYNPPCPGCGLCRMCCECDNNPRHEEDDEDAPLDVLYAAPDLANPYLERQPCASPHADPIRFDGPISETPDVKRRKARGA